MQGIFTGPVSLYFFVFFSVLFFCIFFYWDKISWGYAVYDVWMIKFSREKIARICSLVVRIQGG